MSSRNGDTQTLFNSSNDSNSHTERNAPTGFPTQLYLEFGASIGHTPWLIIPAAIWSLISIMGIMMNSSVVYVTARSMYVFEYLMFTARCENQYRSLSVPWQCIILHYSCSIWILDVTSIFKGSHIFLFTFSIFQSFVFSIFKKKIFNFKTLLGL